MNDNLINPFIKAININDLPEDAWRIVMGEDTAQEPVLRLYEKVPWLYRGVQIKGSALSRLPFDILRGGNVIDSDKTYQNVVEFFPEPRRILALVEMGLTLLGKHYLSVDRNLMGTQILSPIRNFDARSITPVLKEGPGLVEFERTLKKDTIPKTLVPPMDGKLGDIVYFWQYDPMIEVGPPSTSPALAALAAAGVLLSIDDFVTAFFARGAIKATLLTLKQGTPKSERERTRAWWKRVFSGKSKAWQTEVVNADKVEPVVVGEGLESLSNTSLTNEKREDIATAIGVPHSLLFSNATNFATAQQDVRNLYDQNVLPDASFIQDVLNEQLFGPLDYKFAFRPERMDIYQQDEKERSAAFINYVNGGLPVWVATEMLGLELPDSFDPTTVVAPPPPPAPGENIAVVSEKSVPSSLEVDLDKWCRKSIKRIKTGSTAAVEFESDNIPPTLAAAILGGLEAVTTPDAVRALFDDTLRWQDYP
jgi:hypothetical protein